MFYLNNHRNRRAHEMFGAAASFERLEQGNRINTPFQFRTNAIKGRTDHRAFERENLVQERDAQTVVIDLPLQEGSKALGLHSGEDVGRFRSAVISHQSIDRLLPEVPKKS